MTADSHEPAAPAAAPIASQTVAPTAGDLPLISPVDAPSSPLVRFGGFLGILGSILGLLALLVGCAGFPQALVVSPGCVALGALGLLLTLAGAFFQSSRLGEDTHVMQALFASLISVIGGVLEMAVWLKWPLFK
jgi:hypothetical protein